MSEDLAIEFIKGGIVHRTQLGRDGRLARERRLVYRETYTVKMEDEMALAISEVHPTQRNMKEIMHHLYELNLEGKLDAEQYEFLWHLAMANYGIES